MQHFTRSPKLLFALLLAVQIVACAAGQPAPLPTVPLAGTAWATLADPRLIPTGAGPSPTPQPAPKVLGHMPSTAALNELYPPISIEFSQAMDHESVEAAFSIEPSLDYEFRWAGNRLYADLREPLAPGRTYVVNLDKTAQSLAGRPLYFPHHWQIHLLEPLQRVTGLRTVKDAAVTLLFNFPMDRQSVESAVEFSPALAGGWSWNEDNTEATYRAAEDALYDQTYEVVFAADWQDKRGLSWPAPKLIRLYTPSLISNALPRNSPAAPTSPIQITFAEAMDQASTEAAFQIEPDISGAFTWKENTLVFQPEQGYLQPITRYLVSIQPSATALDGSPVLREAFQFPVSTSYLEQGLSFGDGPNVQVLAADGRRAVQFIAKEELPVQVELYRLTPAQFRERYATGFRVQNWNWGWFSWGDEGSRTAIDSHDLPLIRTWTEDLADALHENYYGSYQDELLIPADVPPGLYLLNLDSGYLNDQLFLTITQQVAMVKKAEATITAWVTDFEGAPRPDQLVEVFDRQGERLLTGQTDAAGLFQAELDSTDQPTLLFAGSPDELSVVGLSSEWQAGQKVETARRQFAVYVYTDRPIYRPGHSVNFKAIIRRDEDAALAVLPAGTQVSARLRDSRNNVVQTQTLTSNDFGTINGAFQVAEGAMLGDWAVEIEVAGESYRQEFKVQDYVKPDYAVELDLNATALVVGDVLRGTIDTTYYYGEPVPEAKVLVKFYEIASDFYCGDTCYMEEGWVDSFESRAIEGRTDARGRFSFSTTASMSYGAEWVDWWTNVKRSKLAVEVTVDDGSHQTVSSWAAVNVFNVAEQIKTDTGGYLKTVGQPFAIKIAAQTISGEPVAGRVVRLALSGWQGSREVIVQSAEAQTDAAGNATASFSVKQSGYYWLTITSQDRRGNQLSDERWLYVLAADSLEGWQPKGTDDFILSADREQYGPGDTATLLIQSSFSGPALLTVERGTVRREEVIQLTAPLTRLPLGLQAEDAPNVFVFVQAWQKQDTTLQLIARDTVDYSWGPRNFSRPDSQLRIAQVNLPVAVDAKRLKVEILPDEASKIYGPRQSANFTLRVTDWKGDPASAEVSLALVDEAIFALSDDLSGPLFETFYSQRAHQVAAFNSLAARRWLYFTCECGGGGGDGGGYFTPGNPRSNFPDTALWSPSVYTDWKGEATVTLTLPDNLTSWRLTAKAATADTQVGEAQLAITTQQPLVIRPLLPRTLTQGDQVELSAVVHNYTDATQQITVSIHPGTLIQLIDPLSQTISLPAGGQRIVGWTAAAPKPGTADLTFSAAGEGLSDSVRLGLAIQPLAVPDVTTQVGDFTESYTTTVTVPAGANELSVLHLELSRSIAGNLLTGVEYLTGYPYGCVEQTMSRALPNAVVGRAFNQLGLTTPGSLSELQPKIGASVQRLYGFQHPDGGWGWWWDDQTDAYQTAWVVFGLSVTADAGYEVDSGVIRRGADWLNASLHSMDKRTQAFALYSLAAAGYGNLEATQALAKSADQMDPFSQAGLALALHQLGAEREARAILTVLEQTAIVDGGQVHWETGKDDGHYHSKTMSSDIRSTALALSAFVALNPGHAYEPKIVRYLMSQRQQSGWGSTNETSFTILALTDYLLAVEAEDAEADFAVALNGQIVAQGTLDQGNPARTLDIPVEQLVAGENSLRLTQTGGNRLYYVIASRMLIPQEHVAAAGSISVVRRYLDPETRQPITGAVLAGQLVRVDITVTLPDDAYYLLVEDRLPGGLEALNEGLNTTSHAGQASASGYDNYFSFRWRELGYNNKEVRGDRVSFFITEMSKGKRVFTYYARALRSGDFIALPAEASAMYDVTLWGRSDSAEITVGEP